MMVVAATRSKMGPIVYSRRIPPSGGSVEGGEDYFLSKWKNKSRDDTRAKLKSGTFEIINLEKLESIAIQLDIDDVSSLLGSIL